MKFSDIKPFTRTANYRIDCPLHHVPIALKEYIEKYGLNMNPDFQRVHVWTKEQSSRYIEYILREGFSGREIYFNHPGWSGDMKGDFVLVDGKQRLNAIKLFFENKLKIFDKYLYADFKDQPRITIGMLRFCINDLQTRAEVLQWYLDMNSGGVVHTNEEIDKVRKLLEKDAGLKDKV